VAYPGFKGGGGAGHVIPVAWPIFVGIGLHLVMGCCPPAGFKGLWEINLGAKVPLSD